MADKHSSLMEIDPTTGYCAATNTFHSIRTTFPLPPLSLPLSSASYALSLLSTTSTPPSSTALIDSSGHTLSFSAFIQLTHSLTTSLQPLLTKGQVALILSPPSLHIPILYFSLLSLGIIVCPSNPSSTPPEITRQTHISRPAIAFTTSAYAVKLPPSLPTILLDSSSFLSMITSHGAASNGIGGQPDISQSDTAAILYTSGTTGSVKGVALTHRNVISILASRGLRSGVDDDDDKVKPRAVAMVTVPLFHSFGFTYCLKELAAGHTLVLMERFEVGRMVRAVEEFQVTHMAAVPPMLVAMVKGDEVDPYRVRSLESILCGGASMSVDTIKKFKARFPAVQLWQGFGMTEAGAAFLTEAPEEIQRYGSAGRLLAYMEAKIVDPDTGIALPPFKQGELCLRGPTITKGYVGDEEATAAAFDSEGWLKTGDLCYFDNDGFLFVVDRLKELIKYKGYQVPPAELEHLLQSHPEISAAAVVPYPDEEAGQVPMAFVVRQPQSTLDSAQVMDFIAKQVAPYKKIRRVSFIDSIPKTAAGKIFRKDLTKLASSTSATSKL